MTHTFKITEGCPKTGDKIACDITQPGPAFTASQPTAAQRAEEGQKANAAYHENERRWREALVKAKGERREGTTPTRMLRPDQLK
jgi:hypothetical protein